MASPQYSTVFRSRPTVTVGPSPKGGAGAGSPPPLKSAPGFLLFLASGDISYFCFKRRPSQRTEGDPTGSRSHPQCPLGATLLGVVSAPIHRGNMSKSRSPGSRCAVVRPRNYTGQTSALAVDLGDNLITASSAVVL